MGRQRELEGARKPHKIISRMGHVHTRIRVYMHTCIRVYVYTCIRAYVHSCLRAYVYTYIKSCRSSPLA